MIVLYIFVIRWKKKKIAKIGDPNLVSQLILGYSQKKFRLKFILFSVAFALGIIALASPRLPLGNNTVSRSGIDVMIALDVSKSMLAQDIKPDRLERSKQVLSKLIDQLGDDRIGIVVFAGRAYLQMPLTTDHAAAKMYLSSATPDVVPTQGTAIVKVFDLAIATTGWNEKRLKAAGIEYLAIHTHPNSHAGYYPDARQMSLKLLVDPKSGKIFGAQGVGTDGVDKRIDVIATAMRGGITAPELADLELAYAPPFGSAKDPVNMLGYVAENLLSGLIKSVQWSDVKNLHNEGWSIVDVRSPGEFANGTLPGAINISVDEMREKITEVPTGKLIVTCQVGQRGHVATTLLRKLGYEAVNLDGGYRTWKNSPAFITN